MPGGAVLEGVVSAIETPWACVRLPFAHLQAVLLDLRTCGAPVRIGERVTLTFEESTQRWTVVEVEPRLPFE